MGQFWLQAVSCEKLQIHNDQVRLSNLKLCLALRCLYNKLQPMQRCLDKRDSDNPNSDNPNSDNPNLDNPNSDKTCSLRGIGEGWEGGGQSYSL